LRQFEVEDLIEPYGQSKGPQVISSHDYFYTREMEQLEKKIVTFNLLDCND
jgi:hypothetical protein